MKGRILWNEIKGNRLLAGTTGIFMAVSAFLFALTCFLFAGLLGSVDTLMKAAGTPDFLQMHSGEIQEQALIRFAGEQKQVRAYQTLGFLNLENSKIRLDGNSLADSTQDNGVCVQSEQFDYLVDLENHVISTVGRGEIYVPVCYRQVYDLQTGDTAEIGEVQFRIAGFLRDSQMNSMMASSKRFLVSSADYERLKPSGSEEYLIEFLLEEDADAGAFAMAYADSGLPDNGPTITKPLIRMMNALSDGLMILVILLVSVVLLLISMLCIRFTLLTQLASDWREIGMLKAIGVSRTEIRQLYTRKYLVLSGLGAVCGLLFAMLSKEALAAQMRELYGASDAEWAGVLAAALGVGLTEGILLLSVRRTWKRAEKVSAVEALTGQQGTKKRKGEFLPAQYGIVALVIVLGMFLMILPQNLLHTISSPQFVTYMGIGDGEIRLDLRQTENIAEETAQLETLLAAEEDVARFTALQTVSCRAVLPDGSDARLQVEQGDHTAFPVAYAAGKAPEASQEIALSYLSAEEFGLSVGDTLSLAAGDVSQTYTVCGIYSDITNGGKTAKAASLPSGGELMWSICYVSLEEGTAETQWLSAFSQRLEAQQIQAKAVAIQEYVEDTYGQTIREIRMAARVAVCASVLVMFVVVVLLTRLLVARDRDEISLRKALGCSSRQIRRLYLLRYLPVLLAGILLGILSGNLLGEALAGMLLKALGATGFQFRIATAAVYGWIPAGTILTVLCAVFPGLASVRKIRAYECCMGKE